MGYSTDAGPLKGPDTSAERHDAREDHDAYIRSDGATGGSVQVQTAAGAANCTDAMVPGNANVLTRATQTVIANCTFAASATGRLSIAAGAPLGEAFLHFEPL